MISRAIVLTIFTIAVAQVFSAFRLDPLQLAVLHLALLVPGYLILALPA